MSVLRTLQLILTVSLALVFMRGFAAADPKPEYRLEVSRQLVTHALKEFAHQTKLQVVYYTDVAEGIESPGATGSMSVEEALTQILSGTGLEYIFLNERTIAIQPATPAPGTDSSRTPSAPQAFSNRETPEPDPAKKAGFWGRFRLAQNDQSSSSRTSDSDGQGENPPRSSGKDSEGRVIEEVVVTGSHIRGAPVSSPVVTITQEGMRLSGHTNLGEVIRSLPQNFSGGQNPAVVAGATGGGVANQNITGGSSLNLRGLGPDATLTLLNGARLPHDGFVQATDVVVVPVAAIERMEVLLDGASAIYGSDAVGGVANIILKRDYDGAELSARYGAAADGGNAQTQYAGIAGATWDSGGFLIAGDISRNTAIGADDRDYLGYMPEPGFIRIFPAITQKGGLFSGHQNLGGFAQLAGDVFYTERSQDVRSISGAFRVPSNMDDTIYGISPSIQFDMFGDWSLRIRGSFGRDEVEHHQRIISIATGAQVSESKVAYHNKAEAASAEAEGPFFSLPGGKARLSIGAGYRRNEFEQINLITAVTTVGGTSRSHYGYGEANLPLVAPDQNIPGVTRLSINGAVRYEKYDTFGDVTTPKLGVIWGVTSDFDVKASWGRSFKVPTLLQQYQARTVQLVRAALFGVAAPADATVLFRFGGNPDLDPESAEVLTAGFTVRPQFVPGLNLEFGWFDIDYTDRVVIPISPATQALSNPIFADFVTLNPVTAEQAALLASADVFTNLAGAGVAYDPAKVIAIVRNQSANVASQKVSGIDVSADYAIDLFDGNLTASVNASWLDSHRKLTSLAPELATAGVIYFPPEFRGRFGASWSREGLTLASHVNHIGGVKNTNITPNPSGGSMTTFDLVIDYQWDSDIAGDVGINLAVTNLFNRKPPFLQPTQTFFVNYDSTNYSAIGRMISATLTKRF